MDLKEAPAPAQGQDNNTTRPPQDLVTYSERANRINLSPDVPTVLDVRIRDRTVRYTNDPGSGIWRGGGGTGREQVSPFAILRIEIGRHENEITTILPRTGDRRIETGTLDRLADNLHRAGQRIGFRGDRQRAFWALSEFFAWARRQAARGVQV